MGWLSQLTRYDAMKHQSHIPRD